MKRSIYGLLCYLSVTLFFAGCQKKDWDEYYGRPESLAPPIYQQLQAKGRFTTLLAVIEKAGYKDILGKAGSWTLFAPTDEAFQAYFQEKGLSGVDALSAEDARKIALYGLVFNPYRKSQLTALQVGTTTPLPEYDNIAYRRQTAYYDFVVEENGKKVVGSGQPIGSTGAGTVLYNPKIDNNKYLPYFIDSFLDYQGLTAADYNTLYPGTPFTGFNVADARVVEADIPAENGIIHAIDKVLTPLPNVEQYIASKPEYSEFKALLDKLAIYTENTDLTHRYNVLTGSSDKVYLKTYPNLYFAPNNENFLSPGVNGQYQSFSVAIPTNQKLKEYTDELLEYYGTFEAAPPSVLVNFINSHLWISTVWPRSIIDEPNAQVQVATFNASNVIENKVLSNANFYGINTVQEADIFRTLYRHAYLNPAYSLMTRAIDGSDAWTSLQSANLQQTLILASNTDLAANGYAYDEALPAWVYTAPGGSPDFTAQTATRVNRLVQTNVLLTPNGEFNDITTGEGIAEAINGEYVKFEGGKLYASGNVAEGTSVTIPANSKKTSVNGVAYQAVGILKPAEDNVTLGRTLENLANDADPNVKDKYSYFFDYLKNSPTIWNNTAKSIFGVDLGTFYTALIPTNAAIEEAVRAGILPGDVLTGIPRAKQSTQTEAEKSTVIDFINYCIVSKATFAVDGKKAGTYQTLLKTGTGESRLVTISYPSGDPTQMSVTDDAAVSPVTTTANYSYSNNLSNRSLIHSINKVLKFK